MINIISHQLLQSPTASTDFTSYTYDYDVTEENSFIVLFGNNIFENALTANLGVYSFQPIDLSSNHLVYGVYGVPIGSYSLTITSSEFMPCGIVVAFSGVDPDNEYAAPIFDFLYGGHPATGTTSDGNQLVVDFFSIDDYAVDYDIGNPTNTLIAKYDPVLPVNTGPDPDYPWSIHVPSGVSYTRAANAQMSWVDYTYGVGNHTVLLLNPFPPTMKDVVLNGHVSDPSVTTRTRDVALTGLTVYGDLQRDRIRENRVVHPGSSFRISLNNVTFNNSPVTELHNFETIAWIARLPDGSIYNYGNAVYQLVNNYDRNIYGWVADLVAPQVKTTLTITWTVFIEAERSTYVERINVQDPVLKDIISEVALAGHVS